MPTFTFYDLQKQPYKCSEIKILRMCSRLNSVKNAFEMIDFSFGKCESDVTGAGWGGGPPPEIFWLKWCKIV